MSAGPRATTMGIVTTSPYQVALFLQSHLSRLPSAVRPVIFTNAKDEYRDLALGLEIRHLPIGRAPYVTSADVRAGLQLRRAFLETQVQSVVTMSPKGGFVGQLAARAAGVDRRLHIFTGQVWEGLAPGPKREAVLAADRIIGHTANRLAADSLSQADNLQRWQIPSPGQAVIVPHPPGSIRGVDLRIFRPRPDSRGAKRRALGLNDDAVAFVQVGRLAVAKGVSDLVEAFRHVRTAWRCGAVTPEPRLFLVGQDEDDLAKALDAEDGVSHIPFTTTPHEILAAMDVLVLASHREGFGSTIIEGAAVGLPAIGTDIVGIRDAIVPGDTGWIVPRRAPDALRAVLMATLRNPADVATRGRSALKRAQDTFSAEVVSCAWADHLLANHIGEL